MATTKRQPPAISGDGPIRLSEWMEDKGVSDTALAKALGVSRETIWKWQEYPTRLNPLKQLQVAKELGIWAPMLWTLPGSHEAKVMEAVAPPIPPRKPPETPTKPPRK